MVNPDVNSLPFIIIGYAPYYAYPAIMTEDELAHFLRIAELSDSKASNVIANLKKVRGLPRIRISHGVLYPLDAIQEWVKAETITE